MEIFAPQRFHDIRMARFERRLKTLGAHLNCLRDFPQKRWDARLDADNPAGVVDLFQGLADEYPEALQSEADIQHHRRRSFDLNLFRQKKWR